jgi:hypothetical protein
MIRVMYRWTVKKEDIEEFGRTWEEGHAKGWALSLHLSSTRCDRYPKYQS